MKDENQFKEKLYNHTMPVREALWDNIESRLPVSKDQKKFPFFWLSLFTALVLGGSIFVYATQFTPSINLNKDSSQPSNHPAASAPQKEDITYQLNSDKTHSAPENNGLSTDKNQSQDITSASTSAIELSRVSENDQIASAKGSDKTFTQSKQTIKSIGNQVQLPQKNEKAVSALNAESKNENAFENKSVNADDLTLIRLENKSYALIPMAESMLGDAAEIHDLKKMQKIKPDPSCYKFTGEEGRSNLSIDIFGGPGFSPRSFENISNEATLYAEARNATERNQYSFSAGGRVNLNLTHEWAVRLGVLYEQTGDIFDYTDTLATQRSTRIDSFFAADGTFLYAETNSVLIFGTLIKKIHNRYHHLDIPLLASYELPMGRATLMVNAGPVINLMTSVRGQILDAGLVPQHITQGEPDQLQAYKTNVGLSIYLGAGALFPITKNISGLVEPRFLYRIRPVTLDTYQLKEHRHFAGLNLGIRYHLN